MLVFDSRHSVTVEQQTRDQRIDLHGQVRSDERRPEIGDGGTAAPPVAHRLLHATEPFLAQKLGTGVMTMGIPVGFGVIVFTIAITAYYVTRANAEFDTLSDAVAKAALK